MATIDPVQEILAERGAVRALVALWAALDGGEFEAVATSFAEDGVWHRQGQELKGPAMVRAAMAERPKGARTRHLVTNVLATVESPTAVRLDFYMTVFSHRGEADAPPPAPMALPNSVGPVRATLRLEGTQWKITALRSTPAFLRQ